MTSPPPAAEKSATHYFSNDLSDASTTVPHETKAIRLEGLTLKMRSGDGVFSKNKLDAGSRILLKALLADEISTESSTICDLGCGWGALGCFLASHAPESKVFLCDINLRAARLAAHNARVNEIRNAQICCGDGMSAARGEYFELVVCNPPIRAGNATIARLFDGAHRCLASGGQLWIVIRTAQGAKSWQKRLQEQFENCETLVLESGYRVLRCMKS
jgi:16S rRNA (guanine1207-N2)-methyltransferase